MGERRSGVGRSGREGGMFLLGYATLTGSKIVVSIGGRDCPVVRLVVVVVVGGKAR